VADANGEILRFSEVEKHVLNFSDQKDSLLKANKFVLDWVQNQLLIQAAEKEDNELNLERIEEKVEKLRNELIVHEYYQQYLHKNLDTNISQKEIEAYYQANKTMFAAKDKAIKGYFIKFDLTSPLIETAKKEFLGKGRLNELKKMAQSQAKDSSFSENEWVELTTFLNKIPPMHNLQECEFLLRNRAKVIQTSDHMYLVKITDLSSEKDPAPVALKKEYIQKLILNNRKEELILKLRKTTLENAKKTKSYEIY
jgi:PPIC-type PPIASE domain